MTTWERVTFQWEQKVCFGTVMLVAFWLGYFFVPHLTPFPPIEIPVSPVDAAIPFIPEAAWVYILQLFATPVLGWLMASQSEVTAFLTSHLTLMAISFACFVFFPTSIPLPTVTGEYRSLYQLIVSVDTRYNACPSLHAGFATLFVGCLKHSGYGGYIGSLLGGILGVSVILSALLTKQHMFLDILCGGLLGLLATGLFRRMRSA